MKLAEGVEGQRVQNFIGGYVERVKELGKRGRGEVLKPGPSDLKGDFDVIWLSPRQ